MADLNRWLDAWETTLLQYEGVWCYLKCETTQEIVAVCNVDFKHTEKNNPIGAQFELYDLARRGWSAKAERKGGGDVKWVLTSTHHDTDERIKGPFRLCMLSRTCTKLCTKTVPNVNKNCCHK